MLTEPRKALKFQSKYRQLEPRSMQEIRRSGNFQLIFIASLLITKHLREKMRVSKWELTSSKRYVPSNKVRSTSKMALYQNGNKSASLKALVFQCLKKSEIL